MTRHVCSVSAVLMAACAFADPGVRVEPRDAPETWFHIIGGNASKEGLSADVKAIAEAGIGGIQFFHGQFGGPWPGVKEQIPCLSAKWDGLVAHLADECAAHGITFKMQNCPGWSMSGGPWVPKEKAMRRLVSFSPGHRPRFDADDDYREIGTVTFPMPLGETTGVLRPDSVETNGDERIFRFAKPVTVRSVALSNPQGVNHAWGYEPGLRFSLTADGETVLDRDCPQGSWSDSYDMTFATSDRTASVWRFFVAHVHQLQRYPEVRLSAAARLDNWEAKAALAQRGLEIGTNAAPVRAEGTMTLVFGHCNAKRRNHPAPPEGTGWECDKMDPAGFEANFNGYIGRLLKGPLAGKGLCGLVVDSWECGPTLWTPKMEAEFRRLNGYELRPWLPALCGYVLRSEAETERFLLDWRRTCSRLVEDNYYGMIARLAHEHGLTAQYETAFGDVLPGDLMRFWKYADEPMCEFWSPFDNEKGFVTSHNFKPVRPCVSAAHLYGKRRVSAEAFTSFQLTYNETLQSRKEDANVHLCRGVTHLVFHTYTHNPVVGGLPPGSSFGNGIGSPFLRLQTWWPFMSGFTRYLSVCGHELERGKPVVDVLWYLGDALGHKPDEHGDRLGSGYKYDYLNRDVLETRLDVKDGRFVLPDGMSYRVLWVPKGTYLLPETERLLGALERKGGRIVRGDFTPDWQPDVAGAPHWYHRRDGDESIYFLANFREPFKGEVRLRDWPETLTVELAPGEGRFFYVRGGTLRQMEPETGRMHSDAAFAGEQQLDGWSRPLGLWRDLPGTRVEKGFSGTRRYVRKVTRPFPASDARRIVFDLGDVECCARVSVNGRELAKLWCAPYRVDVTEALKDGENEICVDVTSTWRNRLIVDAGLPEAERQTWTIKGPDKGHGFAPSGWVGPVKFTFERECVYHDTLDLGKMTSGEQMDWSRAHCGKRKFTEVGAMSASATDYFVDSDKGDDARDGRTPATAWRSLGKVSGASLAAGDVVRFRRGGLWRGSLTPRSGEPGRPVTYTTYGSGQKPIIQNSVDQSKPSDWFEESPGLWSTHGGISKDVGILIVNHGERWGVKKWNNPDWTVPKDEKWQRSVRMENELDYWYDEKGGRVVVRYPKNPGEAFGSIELALTSHVVNEGGKHDVTYDGLWVRYGAAHGFGGGSVVNLVIRNCDISWIGGGLQFWRKDDKTGKTLYPVRFGNGIEFWGDCRNCLIERCRLWEIYDAALTNQGQDDRETEVTWRDNVIWNSEFSYEYWNRGMTRNVLFEHNTCVDAGRSWAHAQRPDVNGAHLMYYSNRAATTNFVVRNNIFCRATEWTARSGLDWRYGLTHDNNLVYNDGDVPVMRWLDGKKLQLCTWNDYQALGFDPHGQFAEPLFLDPKRRDYRLRADSPGLTLGSDGQPVGARNMPGLDEDQSI